MNEHIVCAAADTDERFKRQADFVCDSSDARPVLQAAIDEADRLNVNCVLLNGTYVINSRSERTPKGGICFYNPVPPRKYYSQNQAKQHVLEGVKTPLGWYEGAVVTVGDELYASLSDDEPFSLFFSAGNDVFARGLIVRNLVVRLPGNQKPIVVFDGRFSSVVRYEDVWATAFDPRDVDLRTAEGIPVPHAGSVAFRGCSGSNFYATEWKRCVAEGFGVGFDVGGEHVYCESLSALYNIYGFRFDCYKGKIDIDDPDDRPAKGICMYPVTCVNLLDEHNVNMPRFGNASHNGNTQERHAQSITIRGMNVQWPNTCPGHTDYRASEFLDGRERATEAQPGAWRGSVEYVTDHLDENGKCRLVDEPFFENGHGINVKTTNIHQVL